MAIRTISYSVTARGISPSTRQAGGLRGEHNATELIFCVDTELVTAIAAEYGEAIMYRIEAHTGTGLKFVTEPVRLETEVPESAAYMLENSVTKEGGDVSIYLIISVSKEDETLLDLYSFPALIGLVDVPDSKPSDGGDYKGITTLYEGASAAASRAEQAALLAAESKHKGTVLLC